MATRPDRYPLHDTSGANSTSLPTAYSLLGFPPNSVADNTAANALLGSSGDWAEYNDRTLLRGEDAHNSSTAYRLSSSSFGYPNAAGLGPLNPTTTPVYLVRGNVYRFDSAFTTDAGLRPLTFQASRKTWIYCDSDGVVRIDVAPLATPAAPLAGEFVVVGVETDATDVVTNDTTSSPARQLHFTGPGVFFDVDVEFGLITAESGVFEKIIAGGNVTTDPSIEIIPSTGAPSLKIAGNGIEAAVEITGSTGPGITVDSSSATAPTVDATHSGAQAALAGTNTGTGNGVNGTSGAVSGSGVLGVSGNAIHAGVTGESAALATAVAVAANAMHVDAFGLLASTLAGASSSSSAAIAQAFGDGRALYALAVDGYAAKLESDATNPKRSALNLGPQNNDPTTPSQGDLRCASERLGKLRHYNGSKHQSIHSSDKGNVVGYATHVDGINVGTTGDILDVTITAEELGVVELLVTGALAPQADLTTTTVLFKDITNGVTAFTSQPFASYDSDGGAAATRMMPLNWRKAYTLVSTTTLFRVRLNFTALVNWYDLMFTVRGVY